jgi:hypothetical protein
MMDLREAVCSHVQRVLRRSGHMRRCGKPRRQERQASGRAIQLTIGIAGSTQPNPATR